MTEDIKAIFEKRVYDLAASTPADVTVSLNGKAIKMKGFDKYIDLWLGPKAEAPRVYEKINERWEIAVAISPDARFHQVSFVNGICTTLGGKHVEHVTNQITKKLVDVIAKKKKKTVKNSYIKDNIWVFVNCVISNPSFESQSKTSLTTPVAKFGSKADVSDAFIDKLGKAGVIDKALELLFASDDKELSRSDGKKKSSVKIPKLEDALKAGSRDSEQCTLFITEGLVFHYSNTAHNLNEMLRKSMWLLQGFSKSFRCSRIIRRRQRTLWSHSRSRKTIECSRGNA